MKMIMKMIMVVVGGDTKANDLFRRQIQSNCHANSRGQLKQL